MCNYTTTGFIQKSNLHQWHDVKKDLEIKKMQDKQSNTVHQICNFKIITICDFFLNIFLVSF